MQTAQANNIIRTLKQAGEPPILVTHDMPQPENAEVA
jgi:hypothetical protein